MKLLLHCCCAPCSVSCVKTLLAQKNYITLYWYNPNIYPFPEYKNRRDCLINFSKTDNLKLIIDESDSTVNDENSFDTEYDTFLAHLCKNENTFKNRCVSCYRIRLTKAAAFAKQKGSDAFTTTLLISPYQDHDAIKQIGEEVAANTGIEFLYQDFRPLFREGQRSARSRGMYMQKYCGCKFSQEEREAEKLQQQGSNHDR